MTRYRWERRYDAQSTMPTFSLIDTEMGEQLGRIRRADGWEASTWGGQCSSFATLGEAADWLLDAFGIADIEGWSE